MLSAPSVNCRDQAHYFAPRVRRPRPLAEIDRLIDQRLQPEPTSEQRGQHHASVRDDPLIIKGDHESVRRVVHHASDLLVQARRRPTRQLSACSGGHLNLSLGQPPTKQRWIQANWGPAPWVVADRGIWAAGRTAQAFRWLCRHWCRTVVASSRRCRFALTLLCPVLWLALPRSAAADVEGCSSRLFRRDPR
jgi:hypothetical protein